MSKVSVVGTGMRTHTGVAERMFAALSAEHINMRMITTGDIKISVLVDKADGVRALRAVHQAFGLHAPRLGTSSPRIEDRGSRVEPHSNRPVHPRHAIHHAYSSPLHPHPSFPHPPSP